MNDARGILYLIPTPIGNLDDISKRALDLLNAVDIIACEDTRHSGSLLKNFGISKKLIAYHDFNESARSGRLATLLDEGKSIAVITDAGSPGISDPAYRVVRAAIENDIEIVPLPGPTALIPALTASGLPTDRFFFEGFLSHKSAARRKRLEELKDFPHTLLFYESPHRIEKALTDIYEILGDRQACLAREISKKFEEFIRGPLSEIIADIHKRPRKGEMVVVVSGKPKRDNGTDEY
jgi:16S rRNA (cytidine1402-2'-O)-methyltransferase